MKTLIKITFVMLLSAIVGVLRVDYLAILDFNQELIQQYKQENVLKMKLLQQYNIPYVEQQGLKADMPEDFKKNIHIYNSIRQGLKKEDRQRFSKDFKDIIAKRKPLELSRFLTNTVFLLAFMRSEDTEKMLLLSYLRVQNK